MKKYIVVRAWRPRTRSVFSRPLRKRGTAPFRRGGGRKGAVPLFRVPV